MAVFWGPVLQACSLPAAEEGTVGSKAGIEAMPACSGSQADALPDHFFWTQKEQVERKQQQQTIHEMQYNRQKITIVKMWKIIIMKR